MGSHTIVVAGVERQLPIRELPTGVRIAFLQLLGDVELCQAAANGLVALCPGPCDLIVTPETKGIPLAHELSRMTGVPYIVLRKTRKVYMAEPLSEVARPFTAVRPQQLWLDVAEVPSSGAGHVWLVDDVVTTGATLRAAGTLLARAGLLVANRLAVLSEGPGNELTRNVISLGHLPVFGAAPAQRERHECGD